ncbi:hypothetical protein ZWY2020_017434 [Hordeum vulgare]|nr:hypothetical protein ZWY2020_017434 [Hordeum vulgare]
MTTLRAHAHAPHFASPACSNDPSAPAPIAVAPLRPYAFARALLARLAHAARAAPRTCSALAPPCHVRLSACHCPAGSGHTSLTVEEGYIMVKDDMDVLKLVQEGIDLGDCHGQHSGAWEFTLGESRSLTDPHKRQIPRILHLPRPRHGQSFVSAVSTPRCSARRCCVPSPAATMFSSKFD